MNRGAHSRCSFLSASSTHTHPHTHLQFQNVQRRRGNINRLARKGRGDMRGRDWLHKVWRWKVLPGICQPQLVGLKRGPAAGTEPFLANVLSRQRWRGCLRLDKPQPMLAPVPKPMFCANADAHLGTNAKKDGGDKSGSIITARVHNGRLKT
jgi:hypothetical protein